MFIVMVSKCASLKSRCLKTNCVCVCVCEWVCVCVWCFGYFWQPHTVEHNNWISFFLKWKSVECEEAVMAPYIQSSHTMLQTIGCASVSVHVCVYELCPSDQFSKKCTNQTAKPAATEWKHVLLMKELPALGERLCLVVLWQMSTVQNGDLTASTLPKKPGLQTSCNKSCRK